MADISLVSGHQVVDAKHIPVALNQIIAKVRTQKPRTAGDDCAQTPSSYEPGFVLDDLG